MSRWIILVLALSAGVAVAQSSGFYETVRYRSNDPFVFCTQGLDVKQYPDRCWWPMPPYTGAGAFGLNLSCKPPNYKTGRDWTPMETDSFQQYLRVCSQARTNGSWEGSGQPEDSPFTH